jgi:hypothetical protein
MHISADIPGGQDSHLQRAALVLKTPEPCFECLLFAATLDIYSRNGQLLMVFA